MSGVKTPGASRLQASQSQERSATMQRLQHPRRGLCSVSVATWRMFTSVRTRCTLSAVSVATWRLFIAAPARPVLCRVSMPPWRLFTGVDTRCVVCAVSLATWHLLTGVRPWCVVCAVSMATWRLFIHVRGQCFFCVVSMATWRLFTGAPRTLAPRNSREIETPIVEWFTSFSGSFLCIKENYLNNFFSPPAHPPFGAILVGLASRTCLEILVKSKNDCHVGCIFFEVSFMSKKHF